MFKAKNTNIFQVKRNRPCLERCLRQLEFQLVQVVILYLIDLHSKHCSRIPELFSFSQHSGNLNPNNLSQIFKAFQLLLKLRISPIFISPLNRFSLEFLLFFFVFAVYLSWFLQYSSLVLAVSQPIFLCSCSRFS